MISESISFYADFLFAEIGQILYIGKWTVVSDISAVIHGNK